MHLPEAFPGYRITPGSGHDASATAHGLNPFRFLTENIPAIVFEYIFRKDGTHGFKYLSPGVEKVLGLSVENYANYQQYLHPDDRLVIENKNSHSRDTNEPFNFEGPLFIPGRDVIWHAVHSSFSYLAEDGSKVFTGIIMDITERKQAEIKLRESDERFRLLISSVKDYAIFILDNNGCVVSWNEGAEQIKGYSANEVTGKYFSLFYTHQDVQQGIPGSNLKIARENGRFEDEGWRVRKDGSIFWANITITALRDSSSNLYGFVKVTCDRTEEKRIEKSLLESETRFRDLTQNVPGVIYQWYENYDGSFGFNYISPKIKEYFNIDPGEIEKVAEMLHPEDKERWRHSIETAKQENSPWEFEGRLLYPDGSIKWWRGTSIMSEKNEYGRIYNGIMVNITQVVETRQALARSIERYNYAAKATSDAIWDWDFAEKKIYRGDGFSENFGYTDAVISSDRILSSIHPDDKENVENSFLKAMHEKVDRWQAEFRFLCKNKQYKIVLNKAYLVWDENKNLVRVIGAIRDMSEQRRLENKLIEEENRKKSEIIQAIIDAQEKERREISYELHDNINQTLATCKLLLEMAEKNPAGSSPFIAKCQANIRQVISEIRNISGNLAPYALKDLGLLAAVKDVAEKINESGKFRIELVSAKIDEEKISAGIKMAMFRIIQEQLNNIIKHAAASACKIEIGFDGNTLTLKLADNGNGFEKEKVKKGSGLHNIHNRVEFYKGTMHIDTAPGCGCLLFVELPCHTA